MYALLPVLFALGAGPRLPPPPMSVLERLGHTLKVEVDSAAGLSEASLESASRRLIERFAEEGIRRFELWARDRSGRLVPAESLLPARAPVPRRPYEKARRRPWVRRAGPAADAPGFTPGFLTGKTVYLSAGHGWTWRSEFDGWSTQRGNTNDIVEDLVSAEAVNQYLVRYLRNAGAQVFTVREADLQEAMVVVDDSGDGFEAIATLEDGALAGFAPNQAPYRDDANPMRLGGTREIEATAVSGTVARWTPTFPSAGEYTVYVSYAASSDRTPDAHYIVRHPGGETHFRVDQRRHGQTWVPLGSFFFRKGRSTAEGSVELGGDSEAPGTVLSIDAVRFGGGMGDIWRGSGVSGKRRWEEASRYYAQFTGAPPSVFDSSGSDGADDVGTRSRLAAWHHEEGEDALYLAWHTNAPDPGRGTSTYVYGPNPPDGTFNFTGVPGSDRLARLLQDEIVGDIRQVWDSSWRDRGVFSAYFGEVNPRHNDEMPSALVEVAFHSTAADAAYLKQAKFRQTAARAMYKAIARFFAERDNAEVRLLPEPPTHLSVRNVAPGSLEVRWRAPSADPTGGHPPTSYRVYLSRDGRAWDNGTEVAGTRLGLDGLSADEVLYVRVAAVNAGGESFPTATLGARVSKSGKAALLLVHAFDRLDATALVREETPGLGTISRMFLQRMNGFDSVRVHGEAAVAAGAAFDSAHSLAVGSGDVPLDGYRVVDWIAGEESTADETFSRPEQQAVRAFAEGGGRLIVTGAEVAWDLGARGDDLDQAFLTEVLGAAYAFDNGESRAIVAEGALAGLPGLSVDDGSQGSYEIGYPDAFAPEKGAEVVLRYSESGRAAAVLTPGKVFLAGVPLEALHPESARLELYSRVLSLLELDDPPSNPIPQDPSARPGGCGCAAGDGERAGLFGLLLVLLVVGRIWLRRNRDGDGGSSA